MLFALTNQRLWITELVGLMNDAIWPRVQIIHCLSLSDRCPCFKCLFASSSFHLPALTIWHLKLKFKFVVSSLVMLVVNLPLLSHKFLVASPVGCSECGDSPWFAISIIGKRWFLALCDWSVYFHTMVYEVNIKFSMYHENFQARCIVLDFQIENVHMYACTCVHIHLLKWTVINLKWSVLHIETLCKGKKE
jgi:hypothetical protein